MPCRLPAVSVHIRGVRLTTHYSTSGAHRGVATRSEPGAVAHPPPLASILLIGNFSGALPAPLCALSTRILVVACDYRECEWASPPPNFIFHRGCGRRLAVSQEWDLVIGSTDCTSIARCDTNAASRAKKLSDGTAWWNAILPVWILCLRNAKRAAVELPRSLLDLWLVWPAETSTTDLWWYGAPWAKTTIWRTRGLRQLVPSSAALTPPEAGFPSLYADMIEAAATATVTSTQAPNIPDFDGAQKAAAWIAAETGINAAAVSADKDDSVLLEGESDEDN